MNYIPTFSNLAYRQTAERELLLDLYLPAGVTNPPLILAIPMAGMRECRKERAPAWLTDYGFAVASIEARGSSEAIAPAPVHDCKAAVRWLRFHAAEYGYNPNAIGAWGHSAGGLLASLLATSGWVSELEGDGDYPDVSSAIQAACDECGAPHDMTYFARPEVHAKYAPVAENLRLYLGGPVAEKLELGRRVSPATYISSACPPVLLIHGDKDEIVPVEETIEFHHALVRAGVDARLMVLEGAGHSWEKELTKGDIAGFFREVLGG